VAAVVALSPLAPLLPPGLLPAARIAGRCALALAVLVPVLAVVAPAWRRTGSLLRLARAVDDRVPGTRGSLLAAVDLQRAADEGAFASPAERLLVERHLADAAQLVEVVRPAELLPIRSLGRRSLVGALALLAAGAAAWLAPPGMRSGWLALFGPAPQGEQAAPVEGAEVVDLELRNLRIELVPPPYTGRPTLVLEGTTGDFQALAGTEVRLQAEASRGGKEARVEWTGGATWPAEIDGQRLHAVFTVPAGGAWRVSMERALGRSRTRSFRVDGIPDRPPDLQVTAPPVEELAPDASLAVDVSTRDDFGLSRVELVVEKGRRVLGRQELPAVPGDASFDGRATFVPRAVLGDEGGEITLVVESWDNDAVHGPKVTRSRPIEVYVPTARDQHRQVLALKQQLLQRSLDLLGAVLVDDDGTRGLVDSGGVRQEHARHRAALLEVLDLGQRLGAAMAGDSLEQRATFLGIGQLLENVSRAWRPLDDLVSERLGDGRRAVVDGRTLTELRARRGGLVDELERVVLDLDAFVSLQQGSEALSALAGLEPDTAALADLLRQAQDGKPVTAELAAAMSALQQRLAEIAKALSERSGGPDEGFVTQLPPELGQDTMASIQQAIAEGRFDDAMELLKEAMEGLSAVQQALEAEAQNQAGAQVAKELERQLDAGIEAAKALEAQQEAVIAKTEELRRRFGDGEGLPADQLADLDAAIQELRDRIPAIRPESLGGAEGGAVRSWERMALRQAVRLQEAWDQGALAEAADYADMTGADLAEMAAELAGARGGDRLENAAALKRAAEGQALARKIADTLHRSVRAGERAREQAGRASEPVREQQAGVAEGVAKLQGQMEEVGGSAFNPTEARERLGSARKLMGTAGSRLQQGRSGQAMAAEQDGLRELQEYRRSLEGAKEAMQPGQTMGRSGQGSAGGAGYEEAGAFGGVQQPDGVDVEMSDPDDFLTPEALRALLQEGAADDAPERYRPVNRGYYEELAR
jgi:hypothetical protein